MSKPSQLQYDECCNLSLERIEPTQYTEFGNGISIRVKCSECGCEYDENYILTSTSYEDLEENDDIIVVEF